MLRRATSVASVATVAAALFCVGRLVGPGRGDLTRFVVPGTAGVVGPSPLPVSGVGYDGQFYYRLALAPWHLAGVVDGLRLDTPLRAQRIGYPALAWALSGGGDPRVLPGVLLAINVVAFGALAGLGAMWAQRYDRSPWVGLVFCVFPGFVVTLSRDLTELLSCALLLAALLALDRRWWLAAALLSAAVLTRETALVVPVALAGCRVVAVVARRTRPGATDVAWIAPVVVFVGWQGVVAHQLGRAPVLSERSNADVPGAALVTSLHTALERTTVADLLYVAGVALVGALVVATLVGARTVPPVVTVAVLLAASLAACLSDDVWNTDPAEIRVLAELATLGTAALVASGRTTLLRIAGGVGAVLTALTAGLYLRAV